MHLFFHYVFFVVGAKHSQIERMQYVQLTAEYNNNTKLSSLNWESSKKKKNQAEQKQSDYKEMQGIHMENWESRDRRMDIAGRQNEKRIGNTSMKETLIAIGKKGQ